MKKRTLIRIFCFLLALFFVAAGLGFKYYKRAKAFQDEITYTYSRSLEEVNSSLNKIEVALEKVRYVTTPNQISVLAADIYTEAKIAKQAFSQLPTSGPALQNLNKFFSQIGNYTTFLAQKVIDGGEISDTEKQNIEALSVMAQNITDNFEVMQIEINSLGYWNDYLTNSLETAVADETFITSLNVLEESITDYPTLLYDGPYADNIYSKTSYLIESSNPISEETALTIAANALGIEKNELKVDNYDNGKISAVNIVYGEGTASVSINGGYLISFRKYNTGENIVLSYSQAQTKAEKFVSEILSKTFSVNYYFADNGVCVFNFARTENGVIYYPDLIKVGVDLSNGDVVFFDARAYIMNYAHREIKMPDEERFKTAREIISNSLSIKSSALCVIPTDGGYEKLCFEFLCKNNSGKEFLVYINTETLKEEQIFTVFKTNGGTLVK